MLIDKELVKKRFAAAASTYDGNAVIQKDIVHRLLGCMSECGFKTFRHVFEIGCGTGYLSRAILSEYAPESMWLNDLCPDMSGYLKDILSGKVAFMAGDAESVAFPSGLDLIVSSSAIQWLDDTAGFFRKCADALCPGPGQVVPDGIKGGGILAVSTFGPRNLEEIACLEGVSLEYLSLDSLVYMVSRDFDVLVAEDEVVQVCFDSPADVLRHLRMTGVTGLRKDAWTRGRLKSFCSRYKESFPAVEADKRGAVTLTYHPVYLICRRKVNPWDGC